MQTRRIRIFRGAKEDLLRGRDFYDAQEPGLGCYFLDCLFSDIGALAYYGGIHRVYRGFHKALSVKFPYAIYYRVSTEYVKVYAVLDNRRDPSWNDARLVPSTAD